MGNERLRGKVRWYHRDRGFGFIQTDDGGDYFFHISQLPTNEDPPQLDEVVEFELRPATLPGKPPEACKIEYGHH